MMSRRRFNNDSLISIVTPLVFRFKSNGDTSQQKVLYVSQVYFEILNKMMMKYKENYKIYTLFSHTLNVPVQLFSLQVWYHWKASANIS